MDRIQFALNDVEVQYLIQSDPKLETLIKIVHRVEIDLDSNYYRSLVRQIIWQQLSWKAAASITKRVESLWGGYDPETFLQIPEESWRSTGLSRQKIRYIRDLTEKVLSGQVDFERFYRLGDREVIQELERVKGIGRWTAEMFLIFSLGRLNVLSFKDVSIQNAVRWLYGIPKTAPLDLVPFSEKWNPYNTIASLYLWEGIDKGYLKKDGLQNRSAREQ